MMSERYTIAMKSWVVYALLSALFGGLTAVLAKIGIKGVNSNLATALRTLVIVVFAWGIVAATGEFKSIGGLTLTDADPGLANSLQKEAVYGCPELHRDAIRAARLVANPGCYATSIILALAPLLQAGAVDLSHGIIADAKSGVSGAGKAATAKTHFMYAADNLSAYSVFGHRHTGELLEQLNLENKDIQFTPHLLPIPRGILSTIYLRLANQLTVDNIESIFSDFYKTSPLVRIRGSKHLPQIQYVVKTNYCDIGFELEPNGSRLVLVSCIDNLLKGAAGQAVQNMNLMCGWNESEGLL